MPDTNTWPEYGEPYEVHAERMGIEMTKVRRNEMGNAESRERRCKGRRPYLLNVDVEWIRTP